MATTSLLFVTLLIDRDASTKLPATVPEYEQAILEEIYGEENVHEIETKTVEVEDFDVGIAFNGLVAKYGSNQDSDAARVRYFHRERDLERFIQSRQGNKPAKKSAKAEKATKDESKADDARTKSDEELAEILGGTIPEVEAALSGLSLSDLVALEAAETEGKGRAGVLSAIDDATEKLNA